MKKLQKCSDFVWKGMAERMKQQRNPITGVTFSYVGTDSDFETFLKILVRDTCWRTILPQIRKPILSKR